MLTFFDRLAQLILGIFGWTYVSQTHGLAISASGQRPMSRLLLQPRHYKAALGGYFLPKNYPCLYIV